MRTEANTLTLRHLAVLTALLAATGCGDDTTRVEADLGPRDTLDMGSEPDGMMETMCEPGLVDCGDGCTFLAGDSDNCGACGNVCPDGFSCAVGRCDCEEPLKSCDGECTDPATDRDNCGMCGNVCRDGDICLEGACVVDCTEPEQRCAGSDGELFCSDTRTDSMNCGVCGAACSAGATCVDGSCACAEGEISCGGSCIDPLTDANHCGNCLTSCGEGGVCMGGACSSCGTGLEACGSPARCTDTDTSRLHCGACGNACGPGEGCTDGACACLPGFVDCDGECAALASDRNHCGACGVECGPLGECSAGACVCAAGATMCGAECAVLENDPSHCGACGNACGAGEICRSSTCVMLNATCDAATVITTDTMIMGEDISEGGARPTGDGCGFGSGSTALWYAVTVPAGQRVQATASSSADLVVFAQNACSDAGCIASSDFPEALTLDNATGMADRTFYLGVRGYGSSTTGTYDMAFTYTTPVVAANASCATATNIAADTTITGEDITQGGSRPSGSGCGFGSGNSALYYEVEVPAGQRARVVADSTSDLVLFVQNECSDTGCINSSDFPEEVALDNATGMADRTFYVGVRGYSSSTTGTYDLTVTYTTPVVAANASCATATNITADTTISGENITEGGARPSGTGCGFGTGMSALYYEVEVPAGQRASVVATSSSDLVLFVQNACSDTGCIDYSDFPEEVELDNATGGAIRTFYVGVRGYSSSTTGTYDLAVTYTTPVLAANASCANATPITATTTISGEDIDQGGARPMGTSCGTSSGNNALYYEVTVPAGGMVNVTTSGTFDRVLLVQDACGAASCTYRTDASPESATLTNPTGAPATRIVAIHNYSSSGSGTYDITFTYP